MTKEEVIPMLCPVFMLSLSGVIERDTMFDIAFEVGVHLKMKPNEVLIEVAEFSKKIKENGTKKVCKLAKGQHKDTRQ